MTTKEKLIALINSDDRSAVLLLADEVSELADQIIRKLPEWGWSYDAFIPGSTENELHSAILIMCSGSNLKHR